MPALTPRQALENRIRADARNIDTISPMSSYMTLTGLVADCSVRFLQAKKIDQELLRAAEHNLERMTRIYVERMGNFEVIP